MKYDAFVASNSSHAWHHGNDDSVSCDGCGRSVSGEQIMASPDDLAPMPECPSKIRNALVSENIRVLSERIAERYTPERCVQLANEGNLCLSGLRRDTTWAGRILQIDMGWDVQPIQLMHGKDYERVRFSDEDLWPALWPAVMHACDTALVAVGRRMEANLSTGKRLSKGYHGNDVEEGLYSVCHWESVPPESLVLYSVGAAPSLRTDDGITVLRVEPRTYEVQFRYYGQVGPSMRSVAASVATLPPRTVSRYSGACPCGINATDCEYHRAA